MAKRPTGRASARAAAPARAKETGRDATGRFTSGHQALNRIDFSARKLEQIRRGYEETDDSISAIADEADTSAATINRLALEHAWVRSRPGPRDLSPAQRLAEATRALAQTAETEKPVDLDAQVELLVRSLQQQIAAHEAETARLKGVPQSHREQRRAAHDLVSLKSAAQDLIRTRAAQKEPVYASADALPTDIDARRNELARRIAAFMESRTDEECGLGPDGRRIE